MYTACIFCHAPLGDNDHIEHFPIGRRLAFDSAKGRLWVVCPRCAQWNLTPIEERWEAVEDCERAYRSVRTRVSTSQIGLARLGDRLDLIRIGAPLRPEFAAWRFGDQLGMRRRDGLLRVVGGSTLMAGTAASVASAAGMVALGLLGPGLIIGGAIIAATGVRPSAQRGVRGIRVRAENNEVIELGSRELIGIEMRSDTGATRRIVQQAVAGIEDAGSIERFIPKAMERIRKSGLAYSPVWSYPQPVRLGLEMALHEEAEWRAMEGELAELEAAWREAERIAGIADDLVLPHHVNVFMDRYRKRP